MSYKEGRKAGKSDGIPAIRRGGLIPELPLLELERSGTELRMKDRSREYKEIQHYVLRTLGEIADIFDTKRLKTFDIENAPRAPNGDLLRANDPQLIVWKSIMDNTLREQQTYRSKAKQCFGVLIGQCGELMQARLQQQPRYMDLVAEGDPLKLLNLIERVFLEEFSHRESGHYVVNALNTATAFANFRQKEHEDITTFYKAYGNVYATYKACGGHIVPRSSELSGLTHEESREVLSGRLDPDEVDEIRLDRTEQAFLAVDFLLRLDTKRYGPLLQDLKNRMNAGRDEYPTSLYNAFVMASRYYEINGKTTSNAPREPTPSVAFATSTSANPSSHDSNNKRREKGKKKDKKEEKAAGTRAAAAHTADSKQCAHCGAKGHLMLECYKLQREIANFKDKKEKKESAGAASVHLTVARDDDEDDSILHCGFHTTAEHETAQCFIETDLESTVKENANLLHTDDILADNQATVSIFHNRRYLRNVRPADKHLKVHGIGGHLIATQVGDFGNFGQVYYHPEAVANILSFYELQRKYQIEYNNKIEDAFIVTTDKAKIKFVQKKGLYVFNPTKELQSSTALATNATGVQQSASVDTVRANEEQYSKQDIQRAKAAQDLYIMLGRLSLDDFSRIISQGSLLGCPVTQKDIKRWLDIYGKDVGTLKGRTTRKQPEPVELHADYSVKFPSHLISLCVDIFFVGGEAFLLTISKEIDAVVIQHISDRSADSLYKGVTAIIGQYRQHDYIVKYLYTDGESGMKAIEGDLQHNFGVQLQISNRNEHVPQAERAIRQIKERMRSFIATLPYTLSPTFLMYLANFCSTCINLVPRKGKAISPRELLTGIKPDFNVFARAKFGEYAQVSVDDTVTNHMGPRTVGAICLGPRATLAKPTYMWYVLSTGRVINRNSWTPIPMPDDVIELLNQRAHTAHGRQVSADDLLGEEILDDTERDPDDAPDQRSDNQVAPLQPLDNDRFIPRVDPAPTNDDAPAAPTTEDHLASEQHFDGRGDDGADLPDAAVASRGDPNTATPPASTAGPETQNISELEQSAITPNDSADLTPTRLFGDEDEVEDTSPALPSATVLTHLSMNKALRSGEPAAVEAILAELDQLHTKGVFLPLSTEQLSPEDKRKAIDLLMFVKIKRDGRAKGRGVANGARQDVFSQQTETSSPTASQDTIMLSIAIDAMERRTVKSADIVGAYLHAKMENKVVLVMSNKISLLLISLFPQYQSFLQPCGRLFCILGRALYGCKESGLLFNKHLHKSLTSLGFQRNPYDRCCYNKDHGGNQVTIIIHVDDLKLSSKDADGVDAALDGLRDIYKEINVSEGPRLDYLGMVLDFSEDGFVTIDMTASINEILEEHAVEGTVHSPAATYLFSINKDAAHLSTDRKKTFHTVVAKLLYLAKHGRPDILLPVCFLTTRVSAPTEEDEKKLHRVLRYLQGTRDIFLRISADEPLTVQAFVDASYAVHPDMRSHTGTFITLGRGAVFCKSSKQKLNVKSSTEAELVGLTDSLSQIFWSRNFLAAQGYDMHAPAEVHQDNKSAIVLAEKGAPASSNTKHMDIRYFYVADRIERGEAKLVHTGTADMIADFFTKPLHGALFEKMRALVMNIPADKTPTSTSQGCDAQKT